MKTAAVLRGTGHVAAPAVLVIGASLSTLAIMGTGPARPVAQAPPAMTTMTVTQAPVTARTTAPAPSTSPRSTSAAGSGVEAEAASRGSSGGSAARPSGIAPSGPSPAPESPSSGRDVRAVARLSDPLGVLPSLGVDLTIGDSR